MEMLINNQIYEYLTNLYLYFIFIFIFVYLYLHYWHSPEGAFQWQIDIINHITIIVEFIGINIVLLKYTALYFTYRPPIENSIWAILCCFVCFLLPTLACMIQFLYVYIIVEFRSLFNQFSCTFEAVQCILSPILFVQIY